MPTNEYEFANAIHATRHAPGGADSLSGTFSQKLAIGAEQSASFTPAINTYYPLVITSVVITISLPSAPADGSIFSFKVVAAGTTAKYGLTYQPVINTGGTDRFHRASVGPTTFTLNQVYQAVQFRYIAATGVYEVLDYLNETQEQLRTDNSYLPLPSGTPTAGQVPVATGTTPATAWGTVSGSGSGATGATGPAGPTGATGPAGTAGATGATGAAGGGGGGLLSNYTATTDPTVSNDTTQSYVVGSEWLNTTTKQMWKAVSVATGAAVWKSFRTQTAYRVVASASATAQQKSNADYVCTGTNDEVQINAAIVDANNSNAPLGEVLLVGPTFTIGHGASSNSGSIKLLSGVWLRGQGMFTTAIVADPTFVTTGTITLYSSSVTSSTAGMIELSTGAEQFCGVKSVNLVGNASNGARVMGIYLHSTTGTVQFSDDALSFEDIYIWRTSGCGVYGVTDTNGVGRRNFWTNIMIMDAGYTTDAFASGLYWQTPDSHFTKIDVGSAAYNGIHIEGTNNRFVDCKAWSSGSLNQTTAHLGCGWYINGTRNEFSGCEAQDNSGDGFNFHSGNNTGSALCADSNGFNQGTAGALYTGSGFYFNSSNNVVQGIAFDKNQSSRGVYQQYGVDWSTRSISGSIIHIVTQNNGVSSYDTTKIPNIAGNDITIIAAPSPNYTGGVSGNSVSLKTIPFQQGMNNAAPTAADIAPLGAYLYTNESASPEQLLVYWKDSAGTGNTSLISQANTLIPTTPWLTNSVTTAGATQTVPDPRQVSSNIYTLSANLTVTLPTPSSVGVHTKVSTIQAAGLYTVTFASASGSIKWANGGTAPAATAVSGKTDTFFFESVDGTNWLAYVVGQNI